MTDKKILHILRYLNRMEALQFDRQKNGYTYYRDYIRMCKESRNYIYGITPKNLVEAHKALIKKISYIEDMERERRFLLALPKQE